MDYEESHGGKKILRDNFNHDIVVHGNLKYQLKYECVKRTPIVQHVTRFEQDLLLVSQMAIIGVYTLFSK